MQPARGGYLMSVGLGRCYPDPSIHLVSAVILCSKLLFFIFTYLLFYFLAAPRGLQDLNSRPSVCLILLSCSGRLDSQPWTSREGP